MVEKDILELLGEKVMIGIFNMKEKVNGWNLVFLDKVGRIKVM